MSIGRAGLVDVVSLRVSVGGEAAVWTTFFSPLDTFVGFVVAVVVGVSFHMDEYDSSFASLVLLAESIVAACADAFVLLWLPHPVRHVARVHRVVAYCERLVDVLSFGLE